MCLDSAPVRCSSVVSSIDGGGTHRHWGGQTVQNNWRKHFDVSIWWWVRCVLICGHSGGSGGRCVSAMDTAAVPSVKKPPENPLPPRICNCKQERRGPRCCSSWWWFPFRTSKVIKKTEVVYSNKEVKNTTSREHGGLKDEGNEMRLRFIKSTCT
jgi:hypothetical protein